MIYISHPSRVWSNASHYSLLQCQFTKLSPKLQPSAVFPMGYIRSLAHIDSPIHQIEHDDRRTGWRRLIDSMVLGLVRRASKVHLAEPSWEQPQALKMQQPLIICLSVPL